MNIEVKQIVISILKDSEIVSSWGISDIRLTSDSVSFTVDAMKYKGDVAIKTRLNKKCMVSFGEGIGIPCTYDTIVKTIDLKIEYSENYTEEIEKWLQEIR